MANAEFVERRPYRGGMLAAVHYNGAQCAIGIERPDNGCQLDGFWPGSRDNEHC